MEHGYDDETQQQLLRQQQRILILKQQYENQGNRAQTIKHPILMFIQVSEIKKRRKCYIGMVIRWVK